MPRKSDPKKFNDLIACLQAYLSKHGYGPSYREMVTLAGLSSECLIEPYLKKLAAAGLVRYDPNIARSVRLTARGWSYPDQPRQRVAGYVSRTARINAAMVERRVQLPVIGRTFAGLTTPIPNGDFAALDEFTTIEVSEDELPPRSKPDYFFVLEVRGDSMIEANIFEGDYIICRKSETANNNEMVVALLTDTNETTLKYFIREADHIRLQPANSSMEPILIYDTSHLIIQGVVVRVVNCQD